MQKQPVFIQTHKEKLLKRNAAIGLNKISEINQLHFTGITWIIPDILNQCNGSIKKGQISKILKM